jgi:hypothetical protein
MDHHFERWGGCHKWWKWTLEMTNAKRHENLAESKFDPQKPPIATFCSSDPGVLQDLPT